MFTAILIVAALIALALAVVFYRARRLHVATKRGAELRPVDLEAFANLIDPSEDEYLKENLPSRVYSTVRRLRVRATLAYLADARRNSEIMLAYAQQALSAQDSAVARDAQELATASFRFRTLCTRMQLRLYAQLLFPAGHSELQPLAQRYRDLSASFQYVHAIRDSAVAVFSAR